MAKHLESGSVFFLGPEFKQDYEEGYQAFKIGALLRQAREASGLTQEEIAEKLNTKKSAISRIENHAEDIKLSTLEKFASVLGQRIEVSITHIGHLKLASETGASRLLVCLLRF